MYHGLQYACLIEDKEISVINENYKRSKTDDTNDDNMGPKVQGPGMVRRPPQDRRPEELELVLKGQVRRPNPGHARSA